MKRVMMENFLPAKVPGSHAGGKDNDLRPRGANGNRWHGAKPYHLFSLLSSWKELPGLRTALFILQCYILSPRLVVSPSARRSEWLRFVIVLHFAW